MFGLESPEMTLLKLFLAAFFINLLYETLHSLLYKTCREAPPLKYLYLMLKGTLFDAYFITLFYWVCTLVLPKPWILFVFSAMLLLLAYFWELYAIRHKRWEYTEKMPIVMGVGVTPLVQLVLTGLLSLYLVVK